MKWDAATDECLNPDCPACTAATIKYWADRAPQMLALLREGEWGYNAEAGCPWCSRLAVDGEHTFDCALAALCKFMKRSEGRYGTDPSPRG